MQFPGEQPGGRISHIESGHVTVFPEIVQPSDCSWEPMVGSICTTVGPERVIAPSVMKKSVAVTQGGKWHGPSLQAVPEIDSSTWIAWPGPKYCDI
jgi:hypothetical protein